MVWQEFKAFKLAEKTYRNCIQTHKWVLESSRGLAVNVHAALPDAALSHTYSILPSKTILLLLTVFRYSLQDV